jgi:hypothetical protein
MLQNKISLFIAVISIIYLSVGALSQSNLEFSSMLNINKSETLTKSDIIKYGCEYISSQLVQKSTTKNWITLDSEKPNVAKYITNLQNGKSEYQAAIDEARGYLPQNPDLIANKEITQYLTYMKGKYQTISDNLTQAVIDISYVGDLEGYPGKTIFNLYYIKYLENQKLSIQFIMNYFSSLNEKLVNSTIEDTYKKTDLVVLLNDLEKNTIEQANNLIERTTYLVDKLNNKYAQIESYDVDGQDCVMNYYDIDLNIKSFRVPFIYQPICELRANNKSASVIYQDGKCIEYK